MASFSVVPDKVALSSSGSSVVIYAFHLQCAGPGGPEDQLLEALPRNGRPTRTRKGRRTGIFKYSGGDAQKKLHLLYMLTVKLRTEPPVFLPRRRYGNDTWTS